MGGKVSFPRQPLDRDRTIIVTGGNTGIGYETAKWIAFLGAKVIIACRSEDRANEAIAKMKTEFKVEKEKKTEGIISDDDIDVQFMQLNLGSLASTKRFIDEFLNTGRKLHVLVCNAGIALHAQEYTEDGNELMFQVNFLGHLLITLYFIPLMLQNGSDDCRIVFVSSYAHTLAEFGVDKIQGRHLTKSNFDRLKYYGNSKLYQVMQMLYMNRKLKDTNVTLSALHPGTVDTEITRSFQDLGLWKFFVGASKMFGASKTPLQGAETVINAAINPELKGIRDKYYQNCKPASISSTARNTKNQDELMKFSLDLLKDHATEEMIKEWTPGGS